MKKFLQAGLAVIAGIIFFSLGMKYEGKYGSSAKQIKKAQEKQLITEANVLLWFYTFKKAYVRGGTEAIRSKIDELQDRTVVTIWNLVSSSSEETKKEIKRRFGCALPVPGWQSTLPRSDNETKLREEADAILEIVKKEREEEELLIKRKYEEQHTSTGTHRKGILRGSATNVIINTTNAAVQPY